MPLNESFLQELKFKTDIEDVISGYVSLKKRGSTSVGLCPFHNEKTPSFTVYNDTQSFYCFGCGAGGDAVTFIKKIENLDYIDAVKLLAQRAGIQMPEDVSYDDSLSKKRRRILEINRETAKFYYSYLMSSQGKAGLDYYLKRGLSLNTIKRFGLGYAPDAWDELLKHLKSKGYKPGEMVDAGVVKIGKNNRYYDIFRNRVMTPIIDVRGNVIAFGGRVLDDSKPKYINTADTLVYKKTNELFALNLAKDHCSDSLILCEGYMDVIAMHQAGFDNAVASLGTALTAAQASLMKRYTDEVLLLYDSDEAGRKAAVRAIPLLRRAGLGQKVVDLSPYKDPDEFIKAEGAQAFEERLQKGRNGFLFQVDAAGKEFDLGDPQGQSDFFHRIASMLLEFEDEIERTSYLKAAAREYHVKEEMLSRLVNRLAVNGETPVRQVQKPQSVKEKEKEDGYEKAQKLMITWMVNVPDLIKELDAYLKPEDFVTPLYREVVKMLRKQYQEGEVNPARILNEFPDGEEQKKIASLFHAQLPLETKEQKKQALSDVICRIKENSIAWRTEHLDPADMAGLMEIMEDKKQLENLKGRKVQLHISFE